MDSSTMDEPFLTGGFTKASYFVNILDFATNRDHYKVKNGGVSIQC
jgi:hypothetical protein